MNSIHIGCLRKEQLQSDTEFVEFTWTGSPAALSALANLENPVTLRYYFPHDENLRSAPVDHITFSTTTDEFDHEIPCALLHISSIDIQ